MVSLAEDFGGNSRGSTDEFVVRATQGEGLHEPSFSEYAGQADDILFDDETGGVSRREAAPMLICQGKDS